MSREDDLREIERLMGGKTDQPRQPAQPVYTKPEQPRPAPKKAPPPPREEEDDDGDFYVAYMPPQECVSEGKGMVRSNLITAALLLVLNIVVFKLFNNSLWALYWLNIGFVVVKPFVGFFSQFKVEVTDTRDFTSWIEDLGYWGVIIGVAVLLGGTFIIKSWLLDWLPPYTFMMDAILIACVAFTSGRYFLESVRDVILGARIWRIGKRALKDPHGPRTTDQVNRLLKARARHSLWLILGVVAAIVTVILAQFVQVWVMTPKLKHSLDPVALYQQSEHTLPFSDATLEAAVAEGDFSNYSTEYDIALRSDLTTHGITGYYEQYVSYRYNFEEDAWELHIAATNITVETVNVRGVFETREGRDYENPNEAATLTLNITSLTQEKVSGKLTVAIGGKTVYSSQFSGTVAENNGFFTVTAKLNNPRNPVFGIGKDDLSFVYHAHNDTIVCEHDYLGTYTRK